MKRCFVLFGSMLFALVGCNNKTPTYSRVENQNFEIERTYDEIKTYELVWESIFDVESTKYYVYFYSTTCSHCSQLKNYIIEKALEREDIYFVKGSSKDQITTDTKKLIGAENPGDIWILGYPSMILILNKKCVKNLAGETQIKSELK